MIRINYYHRFLFLYYVIAAAADEKQPYYKITPDTIMCIVI